MRISDWSSDVCSSDLANVVGVIATAGHALHTRGRALGGLQGSARSSHPDEVGRDMQYGTVKWFNDAKGFVFIAPEAGSAEIFGHFSAIETKVLPSIQEGKSVSYAGTRGPNGPQAADVPPIKA